MDNADDIQNTNIDLEQLAWEARLRYDRRGDCPEDRYMEAHVAELLKPESDEPPTFQRGGIVNKEESDDQ